MAPHVQLADGLVLFQSRLPASEQRELWTLCRELAEGAVPMYTPTVRGGKKMSVGMLCLGKHWNAVTYKYEDRRSDFDGLAVPEIPRSGSPEQLLDHYGISSRHIVAAVNEEGRRV